MLSLAVVVAGPAPLALAWAHEDTTRSAGHRTLLALLAWMALQSGVALGLGLIGELRLWPTLFVEALLAAAGMAALRGVRIDLRPARPLSAVERFTIASIALVGTSLLLRFAAQPITENDSLGYHLPPMARWVQAGALVSIERNDQAAYYPYGWELLGTLFLLPLREDFLVTSANVIAWAMLGLATYLVWTRRDCTEWWRGSLCSRCRSFGRSCRRCGSTSPWPPSL